MEKPTIIVQEVPIYDNNSTIETKNQQLADIRRRKSNLWKALILSSGIDIAMSVFELPFMIETFGLTIPLKEVVEYVISNWVAGENVDLKNRSRIVGMLPIPGVTSVSVQALKEIWKLNRKEKELTNA